MLASVLNIFNGSLIAQSFTDIIHFDDDGEDHYINFFTLATSSKDEVLAFIRQSIADSGLGEAIVIAVPANK